MISIASQYSERIDRAYNRIKAAYDYDPVDEPPFYW